jgi:putative CocE/NonD family hydrolase
MHTMDLARYDLKIPMRDGIRLSADVFLPAAAGRHTAVFNMTPYGTVPGSEVLGKAAAAWTSRGYAYVAVDVRGRYGSGGQWYPHPPAERLDGLDVIAWIAGQSWSDGRVVTVGHSYSGWNQWPIAAEADPRHVAMMSSGSPTSLFQDWPNLDGVLSLQPIATWALGMMYGSGNETEAPPARMSLKDALWHLRLSELDELMAGRRLPFWQDWLAHDSQDGYWEPLQMDGRYARIRIPTFNVSGWFDARLKGQVAAYVKTLRTAPEPDKHMLVLGPWLHSPMGQAPVFALRDFGARGTLDLDRLRAEWLEHVVRGGPPPRLRGVLYFLQVANEWRQADAWPVPGTRFTDYFLDSGGAANTRHGDGALRTDGPGRGPADSFTYDPADPVPTNWSPTRAEGILPKEPQDNREVEERPDVLVYSTAPLAQDVEVTGPVTAVIHFSTDVPDTDITVKLLDVDRDGMAFQLSYGIARARYRDSYQRPRPLQPGQICSVDIELQPTSNYFKAGHCIRIEVSSSNFPFYARNLNTGENNYTTTRMQVAHTRIEHSAAHPSRIVLPIVPAGGSRAVAP